MSNATDEKTEEEVKSFHLAGKEHSFHLEGTHKDAETEAGPESSGSGDDVKSFHLADKEHSFKKS